MRPAARQAPAALARAGRRERAGRRRPAARLARPAQRQTGGTPATGGTTGTGGPGSNAICKFASGLNVAWVNFAGDIPNPNLTTFNTIFTNSASVGGRVIRWWFHTNGTVTPGYDSSTGLAMPLTSGAINDVVSLANAAHTAGVALNISLWSFDMLQGGENITTTLRTNNQNLLTVDANRNAYVDQGARPVGHRAQGEPAASTRTRSSTSPKG